jgi:hypothetical protein
MWRLQAEAKKSEITYIMVKPDGVQRNLVGKIVQRFEDKGYKLIAMKMMRPTREQFEVHYGDLASRSFFPGLVAYMVRVWMRTRVPAVPARCRATVFRVVGWLCLRVMGRSRCCVVPRRLNGVRAHGVVCGVWHGSFRAPWWAWCGRAPTSSPAAVVCSAPRVPRTPPRAPSVATSALTLAGASRFTCSCADAAGRCALMLLTAVRALCTVMSSPSRLANYV